MSAKEITGGAKKGQAVFEFVIAAFLLFAVIIYSLSYLSNSFDMHHTIFSSSRAEDVALRISDVLVGNENNGFVSEWPDMDIAKMQAFDNDCDTMDYFDFLESLGLKDISPYDRYTRVYITATGVDSGTDYVSCIQRTPPDQGIQGTVTRFAYVPDAGEIVKIDVTVW